MSNRSAPLKAPQPHLFSIFRKTKTASSPTSEVDKQEQLASFSPKSIRQRATEWWMDDDASTLVSNHDDEEHNIFQPNNTQRGTDSPIVPMKPPSNVHQTTVPSNLHAAIGGDSLSILTDGDEEMGMQEINIHEDDDDDDEIASYNPTPIIGESIVKDEIARYDSELVTGAVSVVDDPEVGVMNRGDSLVSGYSGYSKDASTTSFPDEAPVQPTAAAAAAATPKTNSIVRSFSSFFGYSAAETSKTSFPDDTPTKPTAAAAATKENPTRRRRIAIILIVTAVVILLASLTIYGSVTRRNNNATSSNSDSSPVIAPTTTSSPTVAPPTTTAVPTVPTPSTTSPVAGGSPTTTASPTVTTTPASPTIASPTTTTSPPPSTSESSCANATTLDSLPFFESAGVSTLNTLAGDADASSCPSISTSNTRARWFTVVGGDSCIRATTEGSTADTTLSVYTGTCGNTKCLREHASKSQSSQVEWFGNADETYYILVTTNAASSGDYSLSISEFKCFRNEACTDAPLVLNDSFTDSGNTVDSEAVLRRSQARVCSLVERGAHGVWYATQATTTTSCITVSTEGSNFDTILAVYSGSCYESICVTENDDSSPIVQTSQVSFTAELGVLYNIFVGGAGREVGDFSVSITRTDGACN